MVLASEIEYVRSQVLRTYLQRTIHVHSKASGCSTKRAEAFLYESSPALVELNKEIAKRRIALLHQIKTASEGDISLLSDEMHFDSTQVLLLKDGDQEKVLYSSKRANPSIYYHYINWFSDSLSIDLEPRKPSICHSEISRERSFLRNEEISDVSKASYMSGCLIAACQLISVTDLHAQNVVFNNNTPIVIDDECVCQPVRNSQVRQLKSGRKDYHFSVYRSLLLFDPHLSSHLAAQSGLSQLFGNGVNEKELINGYKDGFNALVNKSSELHELLDHSYKQSRWVRYLLRSTRFYDYLKEQVLLSLCKNGSQSEAEMTLSKLFIDESKMFPELDSCVNDEMRQLQAFDTPYYLIDVNGGEISNNKLSGEVLLTIEPPATWVRRTVPIIIKRSVDVGINEIKESISCFKKQKI